MNSIQNNTFVHIEELLNVFNDIDIRIRTLHQNSSQVFLQLNDFLKDYYRKNSIVSTNAAQIFDTIAGNKESCLTCELNEIFNEFEDYKSRTDDEIERNLVIYNQLNIKLDAISLLIRNIRQDLLTLKYLTANFKIISNNEAFGKRSVECINKWEKTLVSTLPWLTEIGKETSCLSMSLGNLYESTKLYSQNSVNKNFSLLEELKSTILLVNKKNLESKNYIPVLKEKLKSSSDFIENIITHLQYHDIIRQKIEHIQQSHLKIITSLKEDIASSGREIIKEDEKIIQIIADISGLQAAQLILISKEYQNALDVISGNFQKIADDLTTVSTISHEFSFEAENSDTTLINLVKERLDRSLLLLDEYNSNTFNKELSSFKLRISDMHGVANERIISLIEWMEFSDLIIDENDLSEQEFNEGKPNIILQIDSLANDIIEKKDELQRSLSDILKLSEKFPVEINQNGFRSQLEKEQIRIMVSISKTLDRLDKESKQLDTVLTQNCCIKKDIIDKLKATLNQADYYELFEKVLNAIIEQLNSMNALLRTEGNDSNKTDKIRNLKEIEAYYTVASERVIHEKVINEDKEIDLSNVHKSDEDLELF